MKALWGVEPFQQSETQIGRTYRFISEVCGDKGKIEIGFIITRMENDLNLAFDVDKDKRFTSYPKEILERKLKRSGVQSKNVRINIVDYPTFSKTKAASRLLKLSKDKDCDICVIYSQGGGEIKKLFLGSFAESAVHLSDQKLLIINPHTKLSKKIRTVLFCYEPSKDSADALKEMIKFCQKRGAKLVIFHAAQFCFGMPANEVSDDVKAYNDEVKKWQSDIGRMCAKSKVKCEFHISSELEMISELALKTAKKVRADLISVLAKSGPTTALIGGSVTRQILRSSNLPVLVLR
jgi:nucleotide-binding universal stress UspA family protein